MSSEPHFRRLTSTDYSDILAIANNAPVSRAEIEFLTDLLSAARHNLPVSSEVHGRWSVLRSRYDRFLVKDLY